RHARSRPARSRRARRGQHEAGRGRRSPRHDRPHRRRGRRADRRPRGCEAMNRTDAIWAVGRVTIGTAVKLVAPLRVYGAERVPLEGGLVVASNHFSWIDPPALGAAVPRTLYM